MIPASSETQEDATTTNSRKRVFVTGAGFTRALVPNAPLLVDDFGNDSLAERVLGLPNASRLLEWERHRHPKGYIDIERLMTRVESLMPYDYAEFSGNAANEYALLLSELKRSFLDRIRDAGKGVIHQDELATFAAFCGAGQCHCITFNYDDFLDRELAKTPYWNPRAGYGFHCPSSVNTLAQLDEGIPGAGMLLLKLHGSVNWRPKLGHADPPPLDAITHHDDWSDVGSMFQHVADHLEAKPVMVPPVLSKSSLVEQPVLRLVWSQAFKVLQSAHEVCFLGYSFPITDMAARTLFSEALRDLPREDIHIVNLAETESDAHEVRAAYRSVLGEIDDSQFLFGGALDWIQRLPPPDQPYQGQQQLSTR